MGKKGRNEYKKKGRKKNARDPAVTEAVQEQVRSENNRKNNLREAKRVLDHDSRTIRTMCYNPGKNRTDPKAYTYKNQR